MNINESEKEDKQVSFSGLDGFTIKLIAIAAMLTDHIGAVLFEDIIELRIIGRIAFPLFCFLLVEGFFHTNNRVKYMKRLLLFALISEIPFDLAFQGKIFEIGHQNVFFTLLIGYVVMFFSEKSKKYIEIIIFTIIGALVATALNTDYSFLGILIIMIFYIFRNNRPAYIVGQTIVNAGLSFGTTQMYAILSLIPIWLYNGKKGYGKIKYFFYIFYPAHLIIIFIISKI